MAKAQESVAASTLGAIVTPPQDETKAASRRFDPGLPYGPDGLDPAVRAAQQTPEEQAEAEAAERALAPKEGGFADGDPAMPEWLKKPPSPAEQAAAANVAQARTRAKNQREPGED